MPKLNLKPNHKAIRDYYTTLQQYKQHAITHEGAVSSPFDTLLQLCAQQVNATLIPQYGMHTVAGNRIVVDQYRVKADKRSGIVNDPNREAEPRYIVDLIGQVIYVSLKTVEIVQNLPEL